jgi:hypothetical protein
VADLDTARRFVLDSARAPLALLIPAGATSGFKSAQMVEIDVFVDPVKRLQASTIQLRLYNLLKSLADAARAQTRRQLGDESAELRVHLEAADAQ